MNYKAILKEIEQNLGQSPRHFSFIDKLTWLRLRKPEWDYTNDDICNSLDNFHKVFKEGKLAWGHIIQVNRLMFGATKTNSPGEMLIWADEEIDFNVHDIGYMAQELFNLKGQSANLKNPETKEFALYLENERIRTYGLKIPLQLTNGIDFRISTVYFQRNHLPKGRVTNGLFPILYMETDPMAVVTVPYKFWPQALIDTH
jgi:hypothetical protein